MLPYYVTQDQIDALITQALTEDIGTGDVTTWATIAPDTIATAHFLAKETGVLAGLFVAERVFAQVDSNLEITWSKADGDTVEKGTVFGHVSGKARSLLVAERLALNLMQRMSGIATLTHQMATATHPYKAKILDTRKTAPGLRLLDKWAVKLGGGENHRIGLYDMVLIKDNHIEASGGIQQAIQATNSYLKLNDLALAIEIETRTLAEVEEVLAIGGVHRILLDNMVSVSPEGIVDTSMLQEAVQKIGNQFTTEASGNVTLKTVPAIAATGVDFISSGALTHSVSAMDISLKIKLK